MKIRKNEKGQDVYILENATDFALLPEHLVEPALAELPLAIYSLRILLVAAEAEGKLDEMIAAIPTLEFCDDGEFATRFKAGSASSERELFSVRIIPESKNNVLS